ncbi:dipeptidase [Brevibacillus fulvus]|uniref:Membrane dipeptidase n=1 Tax=Brevibacillus fulvus TaxID=1125967 RepID=A0A939BVC8_9BACL|nr:dipeptidase [Brevibacillus fulvus]MBM7590536.1 membrane dipeptidase [Brevibacillus fulvus]
MSKVFDAHCDALLKLWEDRTLRFARGDERLQVSLPEMKRGNVHIQVFDVWVPTEHKGARAYRSAMEMIKIFHQQVAVPPVTAIYSRGDLEQCVLKEKKGAILFIEGGHPLGHDLGNLHELYRMGVRGIGLTWNIRNQLADGCLQPSPRGLTLFGRQVVREMNRLGMMVDVSHLAEPGFWEVLELSSTPVIASHSNTRKLCDHPRNLTDQQIRALIEKDSVMGLTFVDMFVTSEKRTVWIDDLLRHLDHVCALGGLDHVAFGSDFDGTVERFGDLSSAGEYQRLVNALLKHFKEDEVKKIMFENWLRVFQNVLQ